MGTNRSSTLKPPLLVALRPMTSQLSTQVTASAGTKNVQAGVVPGGGGTGAPVLSNTGAVRPIQVACRLPLDICHSPLTRWPPSTSSARALIGGPQLRAARGGPHIWRATAGSTAHDVAAQPLIWPTHQAVLPSSLASASMVRNHVPRSTSSPS